MQRINIVLTFNFFVLPMYWLWAIKQIMYWWYNYHDIPYCSGIIFTFLCTISVGGGGFYSTV